MKPPADLAGASLPILFCESASTGLEIEHPNLSLKSWNPSTLDDLPPFHLASGQPITDSAFIHYSGIS